MQNLICWIEFRQESLTLPPSRPSDSIDGVVPVVWRRAIDLHAASMINCCFAAYRFLCLQVTSMQAFCKKWTAKKRVDTNQGRHRWRARLRPLHAFDVLKWPKVTGWRRSGSRPNWAAGWHAPRRRPLPHTTPAAGQRSSPNWSAGRSTILAWTIAAAPAQQSVAHC